MMRLLNTKSLRLDYFQGEKIPKYAILSHTWEEEEILFEDLDPAKNPVEGQLATTKRARDKFLGSVAMARGDGHDYIWIDSCCIDKPSSAELSEAINSMFDWCTHPRASATHIYPT
jgi:hypothetical protein